MPLRSVEPPHVLIDWRTRERARQRAHRWQQFFRIGGAFLAGFAFAFALFFGTAHATWKPEYADATPAVQDWYAHAELTPEAQKRFMFKGCCDHADVVRTQFRVNKTNGQDEWFYLDRGEWKLIPADIIHWGEHAPDGQPTLFRLGEQGAVVCFYPGEDGN